MSNKISKSHYEQLKTQIAELLKQGREQAGKAVNTILLQTYWQIGRYIVEFEQKGKEKAEYGAELLDKLSKDLTLEYGKGFSRSNLFQICQFYIKFQKIQTLSEQFWWSMLLKILQINCL